MGDWYIVGFVRLVYSAVIPWFCEEWANWTILSYSQLAYLSQKQDMAATSQTISICNHIIRNATRI